MKNNETLIGATVYDIKNDVVIYKRPQVTKTGVDYVLVDHKGQNTIVVYIKDDSDVATRDKCLEKAISVLVKNE